MTTKNNQETIDLVISFDTTGSMYPCLTQVRRNVRGLVNDLFTRVPDLRIGIIAHGDYCDEGSTYVTRELDLTDDAKSICGFIDSAGPTGGGDSPECYELVLRRARQMSWRSGKAKAFMLIGDDVPHPPHYSMNVQKIDWRNELELLLEARVNVYGVHAMPGCRAHSRPFYEEIAKKTGGFYLTLDQFSIIGDVITAVALKQDGPAQLQTFVDDLASRGRMTRNMSSVISTLTGRKVAAMPSIRDAAGNELVPVPTGRFQILDVDADAVIKDFVEAQGARFKPGRGFYQLTKSEKVQGYKEIILSAKGTGDIYTGPKVRELLGLGTDDGRLSTKSFLSSYDIFVQSNSYNRKLTAGTKFLYEVEDWDAR